MGCSKSKQKKLDLSSSSNASTASVSKSNRKPPTKLKKSTLSEQLTSEKTEAKQTVAVTKIDDNRNGSRIDRNNKVDTDIQRSVSPLPLKPQKQKQQLQQQTVDGVKSTQSTRPTPTTTTTTTTHKFGWSDEQLLSQLQFLDFDTSSNIVRLFDEGNTIPFICRYRRELINNLDADKYIYYYL